MPTKKTKENETKWTLLKYDLWGNEEDGYEVNDYFPTSITLTTKQMTGAGIIRAIRKAFWFKESRPKFEIEDGGFLKYDRFPVVEDAENGPLCIRYKHWPLCEFRPNYLG